MTRVRCVLLDRDGVLNDESGQRWVQTPAQWRWLPGSLGALEQLARAGFRLALVTNQSVVGRGLISARELDRIHELMRRDAARIGARFDSLQICAHAPDAGCACRKPRPGLLRAALRELGAGPEEAVFIGDSASDLVAGAAAGVDVILVRTGKGRGSEREVEAGRAPAPLAVYDDLAAAAQALCAEARPRGSRGQGGAHP